MNDIFEMIQGMRKHFGWDKTDTRASNAVYLLEEANELVQSLDLSEAEFKKELADVLMYAFAICMDENYDVHELIASKIQEVMQREY